MAKSSSSTTFILAGIGLLAIAMATRKPKSTIWVLKTAPANPSLPPPPPAKEPPPVKVDGEHEYSKKIALYEGQFAVPFPSKSIASDEIAPLIIVLLPYSLTLSDKNNYSVTSDYNNTTLSNLPQNLNGRVFYIAIPNYVGTLEQAAKTGKALISGLKKLQETYPTNKIIVTAFDYSSNIALYLAASNAVDYAFIYGPRGNYNYLVGHPGTTKLIGWLTPNAVGDKWYAYDDSVYSTYKAFELFGKANYPLPNFVTGADEYKWTTQEIYQVVNNFINSQLFVPGKTDPGFVIEWDGNLNKCAIIVKPDKLGLAVWSMTTMIVDASRISNKKVTYEDFWGFVDAFYMMLNSKCTLQGRYYDDEPSAMFGYLAIRSAIRALWMRGLMTPKDAEIAITQAKNEAIQNGVTDNSKYLPGLQNEFEV